MISLYAHGSAKIEVGKYGMTLADATKAFLATCEEAGVEVDSLDAKDTVVNIIFTYDLDALWKLLQTVAKIGDVHCEPPNHYSLETPIAPAGAYVKTGWYSD